RPNSSRLPRRRARSEVVASDDVYRPNVRHERRVPYRMAPKRFWWKPHLCITHAIEESGHLPYGKLRTKRSSAVRARSLCVCEADAGVIHLLCIPNATAPEARDGRDIILELFMVERM